MPPAAKETQDPEETTEAGTEESAKDRSISCKVDLATWQKINYLALQRSMKAGQKVTVSRTAGEILEKAAESLEGPPADLVN